MFPNKSNSHFTDSQKHALDCQRNLAVRANAGSGKTSVLVDRILQILKHNMGENLVDFSPDQGVTLSQIVSITFTRKAAAELKHRLRGLLLEQIEAEGIQSWEQDWWNARLEELEIAEIGTIDSFFGGILREYALYDSSDYPVEPDFQVLDPFDADQLRLRAIQSVLQIDTKAHEALKTALAWWKRLDGPIALEGHLLTLLVHSAGVNKILASNKKANPESIVQGMLADYPPAKLLNSQREDLRQHLGKIVSKVQEVKKPTKTNLESKETAESILNFLDDPNQSTKVVDELIGFLLTKDGDARKLGNFKVIQNEMEHLQGIWTAALQEPKIDPALEIRALHGRNHLMVILNEVHHEYMRLCTSRNALDFDAVARKVLWLFETYPHVPEELKKRFRFIQVDEFQDTSRLQWEILSYLAGKGPDCLLDEDRLFIVGDPQQSIYGFRQADVSVFQEVQSLIRDSNKKHGHHRLPTHYEQISNVVVEESFRLGEMRLSENFRTLEYSPLQVFNKLFTYVFNHEGHGLDWNQSFQVKFQELIPGLSVEAQGETVYLECDKEDSAAEEGEEGASEGIDQNQVRMIADELLRYHGKARNKPGRDGQPGLFLWEDMAILIPSRNKILRNLEEHLRARGIPYTVHGGVGFWQRQEILDMMQLCLCLSQPGDDLSLLGALRGPAITCNDADLLFLHFLGARSLPRGLSILQSTAKDLAAACKPGKLNRLTPEDLQSLQLAWSNFTLADRERLVIAANRIGLEGKWRLLADRMSHTDLLQHCLEESGAYRKYASQHDGNQVIANLGQFFEFLRLEESKPGASLARVAIALKQRAEESSKDAQASVEVEGMGAVQIMTVHASKGLQFPLVVVPNLQRQVGTHNKGRVMVDSQGNIGLKIRHPERPREEEANHSYTRAAKEAQARELAEARRLFYVATTRAEEVLILSAQKPTKKSQSWRQWFYDALDLQPSHFEAGFWEKDGVKVRLRTTPDANIPMATMGWRPDDVPIDLTRHFESPCLSPMAVTRLEEATREFENNQAKWHLKEGFHVQPNYTIANMEDFGSERKSKLGRKIGALIGTVVHRGLERFEEWIDQNTNEKDAWIERLVDAELGLVCREMDEDDETMILNEGEIQAIKKQVGKLIVFAQSPDVKPLLKARGKVEQDFVLPLAGWLIHGRMDKWIERDGQLEIIDWKTDSGAAGRSIEKHRFQMQLYALALISCQLAPAKQEFIKAHLVLLDHNLVHEFQFQRQDLMEFQTGLGKKLAAMKSTIACELSEAELAQLAGEK